MPGKQIHIQRLQAASDVVTLTLQGTFDYVDLCDAVDETVAQLQGFGAPCFFIINLASAKFQEFGLMSAMFRVSDKLRGHVDLCVVVAAPLIIQEGIRMMTRLDTSLCAYLQLASSLSEALLMLGMTCSVPALIN